MEFLNLLNAHYPISFQRLDLLRDAGSCSYLAHAGNAQYFLRVIKPAFLDTALMGVDIQIFLEKKGFLVPPVVMTGSGTSSIRAGDHLLILYPFLEGRSPLPEQDAPAIGAVVGALHRSMEDYPGPLIKRDKQYYVDRYIRQLHAKQYPKAHAFQAHGEALWERVKDLPRGYCHGDLYDGNLHKTPDGRLYVLDFDTSCQGFPLYDLALICNRTHYFAFDPEGYERSKAVFLQAIQEYQKVLPLSPAEMDGFFDLIALYHFALQGTILELYGLDCVDEVFLDKQLDWLNRWEDHCNQKGRRSCHPFSPESSSASRTLRSR